MKKQELTFGEVRAMYFDDTALELPPTPLYRLDVKGSRHYFTINPFEDLGDYEVNELDQYRFYSGVTTVTGSTLPKPEQLVKWIADMGYDNAIKYRDERAAYGTLMHTIFAHVLINGSIDLDFVDSLVHQYVNRENVSEVKVWEWSEDIKQDVIAFAQFVKDYDVKPLAIEISLKSDDLGIAGTVDLPCLMTIPTKGFWGEEYKSGEKKGQPKETVKDLRYLCIVDFKSGRKSYGGDVSCAAQLHLYRELWFDNFNQTDIVRSLNDVPEDFTLPVRLFNWSPKDWRTTPGYHLAEQTESFSYNQAMAMLDMYRLSNKPIEERSKTFYSGTVTLGEDPEGAYQVKTAPELAHERVVDDSPTDQWEYLTVDQLVEEIGEGVSDGD